MLLFAIHKKLKQLLAVKAVKDRDLILYYKETSDIEVIGIFYKKYMHLVLGQCINYVKNIDIAKDLTMEVFERLIVLLKEHNIENFQSWLYSVTRNHCLMYLRKNKNLTQKQKEFSLLEDKSVELTEDLHLKEELLETEKEKLAEGIKKLKDEQSICVSLFYLKQKSYVEIAEETGYSMNEVKSYIQNGKRNLKIFLEK